MADSTSTQPNTTLYINNLNDKINKEEIRSQLYSLFTTYGKLIDVVVTKTPKMRGQAFLVFTDLASATAALRACDGMLFYNKPQRISYAKSKSHATLRREDPNFIPPNFAHASSAKRVREAEEPNVRTKREKVADDDDEEMDIDDDDDEAGPPEPTTSNSTSCISVFDYGTMFTSSCSTAHLAQVQPSNKLQCSNLPQEVTNGVLAVLFQQYAGFQTAQVKPSTKPNTSGEKVKTAEVVFENAQLAAAARQMLDGFQLKKGWNMSVTFLP
ncbi:RNA-binding domain-containing protein [Russula compacta]|nr:RNA-binding domain-containing protein [Russula compacta]